MAQYLTFSAETYETYDVVFLVPRLVKDELQQRFMEPFGIAPEACLAYQLYLPQKNTPKKVMREFLDDLIPDLEDMKAQYVVVTDAGYFKTLTGESKAEPHLGYVLDIPKTTMKAVYAPSLGSIFHDPDKNLAKINQAMMGLAAHAQGIYTKPGEDIIKFAAYPETVDSIRTWLQRLLNMDCDLTCDTETFSLRFHEAGLGTISFAWNQGEGIAFPVDMMPTMEERIAVRGLLLEFFREYRKRGHRLIFHNLAYDATVLIYQIFMDGMHDMTGMLEGLQVLVENTDDTKIIAYLATNSCAGNELGLKSLSHEYSGNYAVEEIKDITRIPLDILLRYNLVDTLSTWFVRDKYYPVMVADQQEELYHALFQPALMDIVQMQLTGLPVDMAEVAKARVALQADEDKALNTMKSLSLVQAFDYLLCEEWVQEKNTTLKKKVVTMEEALAEKAKGRIGFNPGSGPQLQRLLFEICALPVLDFTDSKLPATGGKTLKKLLNHTQDQDILDFLQALIDYKAVNKILGTFIPAMEAAVPDGKGWHWLCGNFNLGGTVSGRLSSSGPNLQNLPATNSPYAKIIKGCFRAPPGKLFCGLDFNSLEDMISALTTKDPNKMKVYTDGYDGHCLRAFSYFSHLMGDLPDKVAAVRQPGKVYRVTLGDDVDYLHESQIAHGTNATLEEVDTKTAEVGLINSIQDRFKSLRQESKTPTFALTYQGTYKTLMNNNGFSMEKALMIESSYHALYAVSGEWVKAKLHQASIDGYITAAFGLRIRTPLLRQVVLGTRRTPQAAEAEGRTAGNGLGQSWCLLTTRAGVEFNRKVRFSEFSHMVWPCAQIHDAQYFVIDDFPELVLWVNEHLVKASKWQDHPEIYDPVVRIGGSTFICHPSWAWEMEIPNEATADDLPGIITKHVKKLEEKGIIL